MSDYDDGVPDDAPVADAEMGDADEDEVNGHHAASFTELDDENSKPPRVEFVTHLTSPVVTLMVGSGERGAVLTAHQALLELSPFFSSACAEFADDGSVSPFSHPPTPASRPIHLASSQC